MLGTVLGPGEWWWSEQRNLGPHGAERNKRIRVSEIQAPRRKAKPRKGTEGLAGGQRVEEGEGYFGQKDQGSISNEVNKL